MKHRENTVETPRERQWSNGREVDRAAAISRPPRATQ